MSMPEVQTSTKATHPAAVEPTETANVISIDPIQSTNTDTSAPESHPEVANNTSTEGATATATAGETVTNDAVPKDAVPKDAVAVEAQPITEGIINYKGPGFLKSLILQKKYFWFSDEPLEHKHLSSYLSSEKADLAHRNAAHATQTGKGLLYYAKRAEDKGHPAGILNLGELTDFVKGTFNEFSFKIDGQKHTFQAPSRAERDGWIAAIQSNSQEAKAAHEGVVGSQGYKSQLEKFAKPAGAAAGTTTKSRSRSRRNKMTESKASDPAATTAVAGGEPARSGSSSDEAKTKSKPRSQSGKRTSIFGTLRAKKEEHDEKKEIKKDEKAEQKEEDKAIQQEVKKEDETEKKVETEEAKLAKKEAITSEPLDAAGIAARVIGSPVEPAGGSQPATIATGVTNGETAPASEAAVTSPTEPVTGSSTRETAPKSTKRTSIFGNFFKKDTTSPSSATETAPVVTIPTKESEAAVTSPTAPQIEDPVISKSGETGTAEPSTAAAETSATPTATESGKPARRSSFFNTLGTKKERKPDGTSDAEGTDGEGKKPSSKFGGLFRKPSRPIPNGKTTTTEPTPGTEALKASTEAPTSTKDTPAVSNATETMPESTMGQTQTPVQASA